MAELAQQEPTMEEILSSIRKIIADDSGDDIVQEAAPEPAPFEVTDADDDAFDDLELDVEDSPELTELAERLTADADGLERASSAVESGAPEAFSEDLLEDDDFEAAVVAPEIYTAESEVEDDFFESDDDVTSPGLEIVRDVEAEPEAVHQFETQFPEDPIVEDEEPVMSAVPAEDIAPSVETSEALADTQTTFAAAGALGKLLSSAEAKPSQSEDAGDGNPIEDMVRSMLRPMLKEWLDANLPALVEKHVEAEVQRIARLAR